MFCNKCGKKLPEGSHFCNFCGASIPEAKPRHARPETEPGYVNPKYTDIGDSEYDVSSEGVSQPTAEDLKGVDDSTKVYDFGAFEEKPAPEGDPESSGLSREDTGDSFDNYSEDDDLTVMDKVDRKLRRDDDRRPPKKNSKIWLWIILGVVAVALIVVIAVVTINAGNANKNKTDPTTATTATAATQKPTEKPTQKPTDKPTEKPTQAPVTQAPVTQAPVTQAPVTQAPVTEAPVTEAPVTEAPVTEAPVTEAPAPEV